MPKVVLKITTSIRLATVCFVRHNVAYKMTKIETRLQLQGIINIRK